MKRTSDYAAASKAKDKLLWAIIQCQRLHETSAAQSKTPLSFFTGCGCVACDARRSISEAIEILDE